MSGEAARSILAVVAVVSAAQFGCASDDGAAPTGTRSAGQGHVRSSIAEGAQLADPVRWTAWVTGVNASQVVAVRFMIDGKLAHVERKAPYTFADHGNVLIPGHLGRGSHTLAVDARLRGGHRLTAASTATVSGRARRGAQESADAGQ